MLVPGVRAMDNRGVVIEGGGRDEGGDGVVAVAALSAGDGGEQVGGRVHGNVGGGEARGMGRRAVVAALMGGLVVVGSVVLYRALERIDNSAEEYVAWGKVMWRMAFAAMGVSVVGCALCWDGGRGGVRVLRRAARFAVWALGVNLVLWMAPLPFSLHRPLTVGAVMVGAGLLLSASLMPVWWWCVGLVRRAQRRNRGDAMRWEWWRSAVVALAAFGAGAAGMLMYKVSSLGWAMAID